MKTRLLTTVCCLCMYISFAQAQEYASDQLIFKFKAGTGANLKEAITKQQFGERFLDALNTKNKVGQIALTGNKKKADTYIIDFDKAQDIEARVKEYMATGLFEYVEPNYVGKAGGESITVATIPNEPLFPRQYGLYNDGSFAQSPAIADADIDMELAWDITTGDESIVVAILDSGVKLDHPEFSGRIWVNTAENVNAADTDGNGYEDDIQGWDFVNADNDPSDDQGHGTNIAGLIAANGNNGVGYAGVDWHCKIMSLKVLDNNNSGYYSKFSEAIYYAVDNGAKVINMSLGGSSDSVTFKAAVDYAHENGVTVVACMMNTNSDTKYYPAAFDNCIAVGATNPNDKRAAPFFWDANSGSNYGEHIDVVAPGNYIFGLNYQSDTSFNTYWGGTSQAAPLVVGVCSLLLAQDASRTPDELRTIIRETAQDQVGDPAEDIAGFDRYFGYGRINAHDALRYSSLSVGNVGDKNIKLMVYPNPSSHTVKVESSNTINGIRINTLLGQEVYKLSNLQGRQVDVDVASFARGVYVLNILDAGGRNMASKKIVID